jgi:hypothetical protein
MTAFLKTPVRITLPTSLRLGGLLTVTTCTPATGARNTGAWWEAGLL